MVVQRAVIELGELTYATLSAGPYRGRPKRAMLTKAQLPLSALRQEELRLRVRGARKKEDIVKIALPRKLCLSLG